MWAGSRQRKNWPPRWSCFRDIGGPARYFGAEHQCKVTGIDLTEEFVQVARGLTRRTKLKHLVEFVQSSALNMAFPTETFDRANMIHVGMNIADKAGVFREVWRVLKPGGIFAIFDILRARNDKMAYAVPWATSDETSFVADVSSYRDALQKAGFRVERERNRKAFAIEFIERSIARSAQSGQPALSLQLLMGDLAPVMIKNVLAMMKQGLLEPGELYARAVCGFARGELGPEALSNNRRQWKGQAGRGRLRAASKIRRQGSECPLH